MATGPTAATNLFGNVQSIRGFMPVGTTSPSPVPQSATRIPISTSSALVLKKNSPVKVVGGQILAAVAGDSEKIAGVIDQVFDSLENVVSGVAATPAAGFTAIIKNDPNQIYVALVDTADFAATDIGKFYNLSAADPTVAGTDKFFDPGYGYSARTLDGASEAGSGKQFRVLGIAPYGRNDAANASGTLVFCQVNPSNYSVGD